MITNLIQSTGVSGVAVEFNLRDIIALQDTLVSKLRFWERCRTIAKTAENWKREATVVIKDGEDERTMKVCDMGWRQKSLDDKSQDDLVADYLLATFPKECEQLGVRRPTEGNFTSYRPFDDKEYELLLKFLAKIDTGTECQATIFD